MAANSPNSPRQRMINLMYLVFIAMLALNTSSEVLEGFELVEESLLRSVKASTARNSLIFSELEEYNNSNPEKAKVWYELASGVKTKSDSLFNHIQDLKVRIVKKSDGKEGDPENLKHPDDLNAALEIALDPRTKEGLKLKNALDEYRDLVSVLVQDSLKKRIVEDNLSTKLSSKAKENKKSWEESMFSRMPLAAAVTLLTKMQNDIRYAEGEVLTDLLKNVDVADVRVNAVEAFVIPQSQTVMRGMPYTANIVAAAVDSTQRPNIYVNGRFLPEEANGRFVAGTGAPGTFQVNGYIEMPQRDGTPLRRPFSTQYYVVEPSATVAPTMMNVLYAGIANPIRIAVPGVASQHITASMTNGTLSRNGDTWEALPTRIGTEAVVTVSAKMPDGRSQEMAKSSFRVRALPDPTPYIATTDANGNPVKFKRGRLAKTVLMETNELKAAIDDDFLNIPFTVLKFETMIFDSMGNTLREPSDGARFSSRQKEMIRGLNRGKVLFIRGVVARGPDGSEREIAYIEITVN